MTGTHVSRGASRTGALVVRGDARRLAVRPGSVNLAVLSPPFFGLRIYLDDGEPLDGQLGNELTPQEFIRQLWDVMAELWEALDDEGSAIVNLGDKFCGYSGDKWGHGRSLGSSRGDTRVPATGPKSAPIVYGVPNKSLMGIPARFVVGILDGQGIPASAPEGSQWVWRQELQWSKANGLPESVTDRCRRSHETIFHFTKQDRYYANMDEIREPYSPTTKGRYKQGFNKRDYDEQRPTVRSVPEGVYDENPLGKLPGSVWDINTEPLVCPDYMVDDSDGWRMMDARALWAHAWQRVIIDGDLSPIRVRSVDHYACVDEKTEILTQRGWLSHHDLKPGDIVAGFNVGSELGEWTLCTDVHRYQFDGSLMAVEKRGLSMRLTPNHRVLAHKKTGIAGRRSRLMVVQAGELQPSHYIPKSAEWKDYGETSIGVARAALLGWVAAEGWVTAEGLVYLSQSLTANPDYVQVIDRLFNVIELPTPDRSERKVYRSALDVLRRTERQRVDQWGRDYTEVVWALPLGLSQWIRGWLPDKQLDWTLLQLPSAEREAVLDAFTRGDGSTRTKNGRTRSSIVQATLRNLEVLQAIAVTLGYNPNLSFRCGRMHLHLSEGGRSQTLRGTNGAATPIASEAYHGTVWCPETATGTFFARRNGKVFITGNSFPSELPRRLILAFSPPGICTVCGKGRRTVVAKSASGRPRRDGSRRGDVGLPGYDNVSRSSWATDVSYEAVGSRCDCPDDSAPTRPAVVLDCFGGAGTTAMVARALGRVGVNADLSMDYCRLASWRIWESGHGARVLSRTDAKRQLSLMDADAAVDDVVDVELGELAVEAL